MQWKVGDIVRLKSGGPSMTVTAVGDNYGTLTVWCSWFISGKESTGTFPVDAVEQA